MKDVSSILLLALAFLALVSVLVPSVRGYVNSLSARLPTFLRRDRHVMPYLFGVARMTRISFTSRWSGDWSVTLHWGRGAGYIGGFTVWLGYGRHSAYVGAGKSLRCPQYRSHFTLGATRNANAVLFCS